MTATTSIPRVRHSDTRDKILEYLRSAKAHPSAETIYTALKPTMPTLLSASKFFPQRSTV